MGAIRISTIGAAVASAIRRIAVASALFFRSASRSALLMLGPQAALHGCPTRTRNAGAMLVFTAAAMAACGGGAADSAAQPTPCTPSTQPPVAELSGTRVLMQIRPSHASSCISVADDAHQVYIDTAVAPKGLLAVFLPGTGAVPAQYPAYLQRGAARGYHVIGLTYVNPMPIGELCNAAGGDASCAGNAREEVLSGRDSSAVVAVPAADGIEARLRALLGYLALQRPGEGWDRYVNLDTSLAWHNISISGHSQGSGHAAYIGKTRRVFRVGMYSGPSDWVTASNEPAQWLKGPGLTPASAFFGYIHDPDFLANPVSQATRVLDIWGGGLLLAMPGAAVDVGQLAPPYLGAQRLLSTACRGPGFTALNQHNCTMMRGNEATWDVVSYP